MTLRRILTELCVLLIGVGAGMCVMALCRKQERIAKVELATPEAVRARNALLIDGVPMFVPGTPKWGIEQYIGRADLVEPDGSAWYIEKGFAEMKEDFGPHILRVRYADDEVRDATLFKTVVKKSGPRRDNTAR